MPEYTEDQIEEMLADAVDKTEKSFGGTFKRLKCENEQLRAEIQAASDGYQSSREEMEARIGDLESLLIESGGTIAELTVSGEIQRQLKNGAPLPERFIDREAVSYSGDPEELSASVAAVIERGREEFEAVLAEVGAVPSEYEAAIRAANPTNPPLRDSTVARDIRKNGAREALADMSRRGMLR